MTPKPGFELCLITGDPALAGRAREAGIERVLVDLERHGKAERQAGRGLFLSSHREDDLPRVRAAFSAPGLVVRLNPLHEGTRAELDRVLATAPDVVMLPMVRRPQEARRFLDLVDGRARSSILVETAEALRDLPRILEVPGLDEIHVGLNDLSLSLGMEVLFETLCAGVIDRVAAQSRRAGIRFGFGGVTNPGAAVPVRAERIIGEQVRLGSSLAWLGRHFREPLADAPSDVVGAAVASIRACARTWADASPAEHAGNRDALRREVEAWKRERIEAR